MGGLPLVARFERPRQSRRAWADGGEAEQWSVGMACFAADLGMGLDVALARGRARTSLARTVREAVSREVFVDRAAAGRRLAVWKDDRNAEIEGRATDERRTLRPLPGHARDFFFRLPVVIGPGGEVVHGTHRYSMPVAAAGALGTIHLGANEVRIEAGPFSCTHPRLRERGARSVLLQHRG
jgi:hypothetical protein